MRLVCAMVVGMTLALCVSPQGQQATAPPQTSITAPEDETATQFYMRYRSAVANAQSLADVLACWRADLVVEFNQAPADQRIDLAGLKRIYSAISDVKVTDETFGSTGATLTLEGTNRDQKKVPGTVYLVKEKHVWKIFGPETWS